MCNEVSVRAEEAVRALSDLAVGFYGRDMPLNIGNIKQRLEAELQGLAAHCRGKGYQSPCICLDVDGIA